MKRTPKNSPKEFVSRQDYEKLLALYKDQEVILKWTEDRGTKADASEKARHERMIKYMTVLESHVHESFKIGGHE